jgi:PAS domain S-box-containing protein
MNRFIQRINSIGVVDDDRGTLRVAKNLVVHLALFMSLGGLVWGSLLLYFHLHFAALIPYGYIAFSFFNVFFFSKRKNFNTTSIIQVSISMLLPFMLQWQLGGFLASGCVMLWSILSLVGSVMLLRGLWVYAILLLYICLVVVSFYFDSYFASRAPVILSSEISLLLLSLNILMVMSIVFVLAKIKIDRDHLVQAELQKLYAENEQSLSKERAVRTQLQISEYRYRNLVEESRTLICTHDLYGNLITVNRPGAAMLGYSAAEMSGMSLATLMPAEFHGDLRSYLQHIAKHKAFESFMTVLTKKGGKRVFLFRNTMVTEPGQEPYVMGSAQDVTEWRKSENRERALRKDLQMIVSSIDDMVIEFDEAMRFKNFWCRDEAKLSRPISYYIGKTLPEAFSYAPAFADKAQYVYEKVLLSGKSYSVEIDRGFLTTSMSYLIRLNPIVEKDGSVKRCTAIVSDITLRKESEKQLKEAFQLRTVLLENLEGGVIIEDATRHIRLVNDEFCQMLGLPLSPDQMIGADCSESAEQVKNLFLDANRFPVRVKEILSNKKKVVSEQLEMVDGRVLERDYVPIVINNEYLGHLWHYHDVTKRKQIERALKSAKEEAEESNRLKTIFLGNLSHEVRTPLQGILGFAEILENPRLSEAKRKEYLGIVKRRTTDMQNIIESLLDMASLETGEIRAFPVNVNLHEAIESIFSKAKLDFDLADKPIKLILDNKLKATDTTFVDPQHLIQVLTNLFNNALKFTNQGSITLRSEQLSDCFQVSIIDTGIGIPADKMGHIFEPFRQAHEGISRSKGGIGLGLAICKEMVQMWGGKIKMESQSGRGSIFSITLPFQKSPLQIV